MRNYPFKIILSDKNGRYKTTLNAKHEREVREILKNRFPDYQIDSIKPAKHTYAGGAELLLGTCNDR